MAGLMNLALGLVVHGSGAARQLPTLLKQAGARERVFLVTDQAILKSNLLRSVAPPLEQAGLKTTVWPEVPAQATLEGAQHCLAAFQQSGASALVAVGGGGVLDTAKAVRAMVGLGGPLPALAERGDDAFTAPLPLLCAVPTSPGSGAEARGSLSLVQAGATLNVESRRLVPEVTALDAELTVGLQPLLTAAAGFNALARAMEAFLAQGDHPLTDPLALESVRRTVAALDAALRSGRDLAAREEMLLGGYLAGVASAKGQGACRAGAQALTAVTGLPHGMGCAALLPGVLAFDRMAAEERVATLGRLLGADPRAQAGEAAQAAVHKLEELRTRSGLPRKLAQAGVRREQLPQLVEVALADRTHDRSPRPCTEVDFERLFNEALQ